MFPRQPWSWLPVLLTLTGCAQPPAYTEVHAEQALPARSAGEKVLLHVSTPQGPREFTLRQLEALRAVEYRTVQPQLGKAALYRGVLLSDLARETGLSRQDLRFEALNDYGATIAWRDYEKYPVLLAYHADGQPISIESKGPLTVVFPTHAYPQRFEAQKYGAQWVWYVYKVRVP